MAHPCLETFLNEGEHAAFSEAKNTCYATTCEQLDELLQEKYHVEPRKFQDSIRVLAISPTLFTSLQLNRDEAVDTITQLSSNSINIEKLEEECGGWELLGLLEKHAYRPHVAEIDKLRAEISRFRASMSHQGEKALTSEVRKALEVLRTPRRLKYSAWGGRFTEEVKTLGVVVKSFFEKAAADVFEEAARRAYCNMQADREFIKQHPTVLNPAVRRHRCVMASFP